MIDSVHYFWENNNRITVSTILVCMNISKRTPLTPKMTTANCHLKCKQESFK